MEDLKHLISGFDITSYTFKNKAYKGFVNEQRLKGAIDRMEYLKNIFLNIYHILNQPNIEDEILFTHTEQFSEYFSKFVSFANRLSHLPSGPDNFIAEERTRLLDEIKDFFEESTSINIKEYNGFISYYTIIKSIYQVHITNKDSTSENESEIKMFLSESEKNLSILRNQRKESEKIVSEIRDKSKDSLMSNYSEIFENAVIHHNRISINWLIIGVSSIAIFILTIIALSSYPNLLQVEILNGSEKIGYNLSNLLSRAIIFAVLVFLISFSFKQYNTNKHQASLNFHRQNAFNSFNLFKNSIQDGDKQTQNELMLLVAKAIFENNQSTGYINDKSSNMNSSFVELTKIIGQNSK